MISRRFIGNWFSFFLWAAVIFPHEGWTQEEEKKSPFSFSAFLDLYYGFDFNQPETEKRLPFLYNHTRHNTPAVNLGVISGSFELDRFRANLALQQGTYVQDNYANEPKALRWIHQANLGLALDENKTIWLDAGVMPSHLGFESAITKDNATLSRSLIAENSPYFETGIKLGWEANEKWYLAAMYLNGWQRIQPIPGKNNPSFGTQATFSPSQNTTLNWSTFLGTDSSLEAGTMIYFSNMYGIFSLGESLELTLGLDAGKRTNELGSAQNWWGTSVIAHYRFSDTFSSAIRYEYFHDPFQGISYSSGEFGLEAGGVSLNLDQKISTWGLFRIEGRWLDSPVPFDQGITPALSEDLFILGSLSVFWN
jgi:hypothetical protein